MPRVTHGHWKNGKPSRTYGIWTNMHQRCRPDYPYGKIGIRVCERWRTFENFLADIGEIPPGLTLDRIDPKGDYEPSNARLVTMKEQAINKRNTIYLTIGGVTKPLKEWADESGLDWATIYARHRNGWPEDRLLSPVKWRSATKGSRGPRRSDSRTYRLWASMIHRCRLHPFYVEQGIKVCERWESYENFLADVGEIPDGLTIDRINSRGDYEPSNVRLASMKEQARNRSSNRLVTIKGETKTLAEWCEDSGLSESALRRRFDEGWPEDRLLAPAWDGFNVFLAVGGETKTLAEWARERGLKLQTLWRRVQRGWPPEKCVEPTKRAPLTINGRTQSLSDWSRETGLSLGTIQSRIKRGWPPEKCLMPAEQFEHHLLTVNGKTQSIADWSRETGVKFCTIWRRLKRGLPHDQCIAPVEKKAGK